MTSLVTVIILYTVIILTLARQQGIRRAKHAEQICAACSHRICLASFPERKELREEETGQILYVLFSNTEEEILRGRPLISVWCSPLTV